jgi:hypothetical protein
MRPKDFVGWVITVAVEGGTASVTAAVIIRSSRSRWSADILDCKVNDFETSIR